MAERERLLFFRRRDPASYSKHSSKHCEMLRKKKILQKYENVATEPQYCFLMSANKARVIKLIHKLL